MLTGSKKPQDTMLYYPFGKVIGLDEPRSCPRRCDSCSFCMQKFGFCRLREPLLGFLLRIICIGQFRQQVLIYETNHIPAEFPPIVLPVVSIIFDMGLDYMSAKIAKCGASYIFLFRNARNKSIFISSRLRVTRATSAATNND